MLFQKEKNVGSYGVQVDHSSQIFEYVFVAFTLSVKIEYIPH
jgi:hypothetical protein